MRSMLGQAASAIKEIKNAKEQDKFTDKFEYVIERKESEMEALQKQLNQVKDKFAFMVTFFNIGKSDEMAEESKVFIEFFVAFFRKAKEAIPMKLKAKIEKVIKGKIDPMVERANEANKKQVNHQALMAEMMQV